MNPDVSTCLERKASCLACKLSLSKLLHVSLAVLGVWGRKQGGAPTEISHSDRCPPVIPANAYVSFRFVMTQMEKACQEQDLWSDDMNIDYAMAAFFAVEYDILTNDSTTVS